jgi:hypothetical protein
MKSIDSQATEVGSQKIDELISLYSVSKQLYCLRNTRKAIVNHAPQLVDIIKQYGEADTIRFLSLHVRDLMYHFAELKTLREQDIAYIAEAMMSNKTARLLTLASVVGFFAAIKTGETELGSYTMSMRALMQCFNRYCATQRQQEIAIVVEIDKEQERIEREKSAIGAMSFQEYCEKHNITDADSTMTLQELIIKALGVKNISKNQA